MEIPAKSVFKAEEVCGIVGIKPYILRFWESEFEQVAPIMDSSGQKLYEPKDLDALLTIKRLLYESKLTIPKAKMALRKMAAEEDGPTAADTDLIYGDFSSSPSLATTTTSSSSSSSSSELELSSADLSSEELAEHSFAGVTWPPVVLKEAEIQKLILAKAKLEGIISLTREVQEKHPPLA